MSTKELFSRKDTLLPFGWGRCLNQLKSTKQAKNPDWKGAESLVMYKHIQEV